MKNSTRLQIYIPFNFTVVGFNWSRFIQNFITVFQSYYQYQNILLWAVKISILLVLSMYNFIYLYWLGMISHHTLWYLPRVIFWLVLPTLAYMFRRQYFHYYLNSTLGILYIFMLLFKVPYDCVNFIVGFENLCLQLIFNMVILLT